MKRVYKTSAQIAKDLNKTIKPALSYFKPPEKLYVDQWADKYRILSPETSAEAGPWRTDRTPYLREPMRAFNDPIVHRITIAAGSQVGKTELELNIAGFTMDQIPSSIMYVLPNLGVARKFSRERIRPMLRDCKRLKKKVHNTKGNENTNTILQKTFPGGVLTICGSETASDLCSTPAKIVIGDERDRWAKSAGAEGDPWELLLSRQITFYNYKAIEVSTPTIKGASPIEASFLLGTQERWCHKCPHCGEYVNIIFDYIRFDFSTKTVNKKEVYTVSSVMFVCPHCGGMSSENEMRKQPAKWIAENPDAYKNGHRSFWLNAFSSPWLSWKKIIERFLPAKKDPDKLRVIYNTLFGELWEDRGDLADEDEMLARREEYSQDYLPEGVLALTCGVDVQDNRLEYEIVGFGLFGETWGIKKGYIMGRPDSPQVWSRLDDAIDHVYYLKNGKGIKVTITCVDSGGHFTQDVYEQCRLRMNKRVFPIKGKGGEGIPFVGKPNKVFIKGDKKRFVWLYSLGVDAGKSIIMDNLRVQEPGAKYCHFPKNEDRNYDLNFFNGLLSEKLTLSKTKSGNRWCWEKLPGHRSNEALDCRNYALAAFKIWDPDLKAIEERLLEPQIRKTKVIHKSIKRVNKNRFLEGGDW